MYIPPAFAETDHGILFDLIEAHPFGLLVTTVDGVPEASHIPFMLDRKQGSHGTLQAHLARGNGQWRVFESGTPALCIFQGPHAYISPNWYPPEVRAVPTWNYAVVHASGVPRVVEDRDEVRAQQAALSAVFEAGQPEPWTLDRQPDDYIDGMIRGIVAFEIPIDRLEGKFKLNQNHPDANREGAIAGLRATGRSDDLAVAGMMEQALKTG